METADGYDATNGMEVWFVLRASDCHTIRDILRYPENSVYVDITPLRDEDHHVVYKVFNDKAMTIFRKLVRVSDIFAKKDNFLRQRLKEAFKRKQALTEQADDEINRWITENWSAK